MRRLALLLAAASAAAIGFGNSAQAGECQPRAACYGLESVGASLSISGAQAKAGFAPTQAGAHPDLHLDFALKEDPATPPNPYGMRLPYATTRDLAFETPPGLIGDPNALGLPQQCKSQELLEVHLSGTGGCPKGSQVGLAKIWTYEFNALCEPIYMMVPPGGDVVARFGFIAGIYPTFLNFRLRSAGDYGLNAEINESSSTATLIRAENTIWGVPADESHDRERPNPGVNFECESESRPPRSVPLPFLTNPTRCGPAGEVAVRTDSWELPGVFSEKKTPLGEIGGCDRLPYQPSLTATPTSARAGAPTGLNLTIKLPAAAGVSVLEPSQTRYMRIDFPPGMAINPGSADGLETCSAAQARYGEDAAAECPDAAKLAFTEFDVPVLERKLKGAIYLREPQPGDPFRVWILADDLGLHIKLPADLQVDKATGQIHSIVLGTPQTEGIPQAPLREVKLFLKSGFRAPLVNPQRCGTYHTHYEFTPWSGGPPATGDAPMQITEGCDTGGFSPKLQAGTTSPQAGTFSPFVFTLSREDGEQNPESLDVSMPKGLAASFAGVPLCEGEATLTGACPQASKIGHITAAVGAGPAPLWVPQEGKRPTAVYLAGPYRGAPLSIVAVVPKQAGPFDFGDEVVRSAIYVDPETAQATIRSDPLPQLIEGIPVRYRTISVVVDRPGFTLNPTSCDPMAVGARVASSGGAVAEPTDGYQATDCAKLGFKPVLSLTLKGGTKRAAHPALTAILKARPGDANIAAAKVTLPHSEFLDQGHLNNICTRVQFKANECPPASVYGHAVAKTPLFDQPLEGPVYLRSSSHNLPDLVAALKGPATEPVEVDLDGRIDSVNGGIRNSFEVVPDAPVTEFTLSMQGGRKGLLINSTNLCAKTNRTTARFTAQNGKAITLHPALQSACKKHPRKHGHKRHRGKRRP